MVLMLIGFNPIELKFFSEINFVTGLLLIIRIVCAQGMRFSLPNGFGDAWQAEISLLRSYEYCGG